jgi:uncharacterized coiled-coil DUF342 family protein
MSKRPQMRTIEKQREKINNLKNQITIRDKSTTVPRLHRAIDQLKEEIGIRDKKISDLEKKLAATIEAAHSSQSEKPGG